jgi:hypothetical protein
MSMPAIKVEAFIEGVRKGKIQAGGRVEAQ